MTIYSHFVIFIHVFVIIIVNEHCETGELRLVGGVAGSPNGVVEVCVNGVWGTFCDYRNEWSHENTVVVCRQLQLPTSSN